MAVSVMVPVSVTLPVTVSVLTVTVAVMISMLTFTVLAHAIGCSSQEIIHIPLILQHRL